MVSDGEHSHAGFGNGSGDFMHLHFKGINRAAPNGKYANLFNICEEIRSCLHTENEAEVLSDSSRQHLKMSKLATACVKSQLCHFLAQKVD